MHHMTKAMAVAVASVFILGQFQAGWALKNFLKNAIEGTSPDTPQATQPVTAQQSPANSGPIQYANEKFNYKVELPGKWHQMGGDPKSNGVQFFDRYGNKGSFQVNANWMSSDFPVQPSLQAMEKSYLERQKHGELAKYYRKDFTVKDKTGKPIALFQGYVTIETSDDPDPDIRRMQWIGYGKGNYYNFTWAANPSQFDTYMPEFEQILNKIQFVQ